MVHRALITLRLAQTRRHVFQLQDGNDAVAEIALHAGDRATVTTADARYDLEASDGIRRRVVRISERKQTVARSSSLGRFAADLDSITLYWHALPGRASAYCWMTGDGLIVVRYSPSADGAVLVQVDNDAQLGPERDSLLILGAYLIVRMCVEIGRPIERQWPASLAFAERTR
jgi:hypothetical protein